MLKEVIFILWWNFCRFTIELLKVTVDNGEIKVIHFFCLYLHGFYLWENPLFISFQLLYKEKSFYSKTLEFFHVKLSQENYYFTHNCITF